MRRRKLDARDAPFPKFKRVCNRPYRATCGCRIGMCGYRSVPTDILLLLFLTASSISDFITMFNYSRRPAVAGVWFLPPFVCVSVCFSARYLKNRCIAKLNVEMFQDESWKPIYFGVKSQRSRSRVTKTLPSWVFAVL